MKKIIILTILTLFINLHCFFLISVFAAETPTPTLTLTPTPTPYLPPENASQSASFDLLFGPNQYDIVGTNCGIPESDFNKCCVVKKTGAETIVSEAANVPDLFCIPPVASGILGSIGAIFSTAWDWATVGFRIGAGVLTGNWGAVGRAIVDTVVPNELINAALNFGDKICFTHLGRYFLTSFVGRLPFMQILSLEIPNKACIENAKPTSEDYSSSDCICIRDRSGYGELCEKYLSGTNEFDSCMVCAGSNGIWTGIGCIQPNLSGLVSTIFSIGIGIAGILAFLCIIFSAIMFQTSSGNPERIKKAKQYLTSCIIGLLLIIFSVFILKLIGVSILGIPGFS